MTKTEAGLLGGVATLRQFGSETCPCCGRRVPSSYYGNIGAVGGASTVARYGRAYMKALGKRGGRPRRQAADAAVDIEGEGDLTSRPPRRSV